MRQERCYLALGWVRSHQSKPRARSGDNLLLSGAGELAQDGLGDGGGRLDGERVQEHVRRGGHVSRWCAESLRGCPLRKGLLEMRVDLLVMVGSRLWCHGCFVMEI